MLAMHSAGLTEDKGCDERGGGGGGGGGGAEKSAYVVQWDRHGALQLITIAQCLVFFFFFYPWH